MLVSTNFERETALLHLRQQSGLHAELGQAALRLKDYEGVKADLDKVGRGASYWQNSACTPTM